MVLFIPEFIETDISTGTDSPLSINKYESNWAFREDGSICHLDGGRACLSIVLSAAEDLVLSKYPNTRATSK